MRQLITVLSVAALAVDAQATVFESLLVLTKHNIHHLPVVQGKQVLGVITATSLMQTHSASPAAVAHDISSQHDLTGLIQATAKTQELQHSLASANASAHSIGHIMTAITDALTVASRTIALIQNGIHCSWPERSCGS